MSEPRAIEGSALYQRQIETSGDELMHTVWDGTPWMVDVYTGSIQNGGRYGEIMQWCRDEFGAEAWPIHGKPGSWYSGGATVMGWTWMGFATCEMMQKFVARWKLTQVDATPPTDSGGDDAKT